MATGGDGRGGYRSPEEEQWYRENQGGARLQTPGATELARIKTANTPLDQQTIELYNKVIKFLNSPDPQLAGQAAEIYRDLISNDSRFTSFMKSSGVAPHELMQKATQNLQAIGDPNSSLDTPGSSWERGWKLAGDFVVGTAPIWGAALGGAYLSQAGAAGGQAGAAGTAAGTGASAAGGAGAGSTVFGGTAAGATGAGTGGTVFGGSLGATGAGSTVFGGTAAGAAGVSPFLNAVGPSTVGGAASGAGAATGATASGSSFGNFVKGLLGTGANSGTAETAGKYLIPSLLEAYNRNQASKDQAGAAGTAAGLADPFASQRPQYQQQLSSLISNPNSITQNPAYKFRFDQGQNALERSNVAKGYLGSGNMALDLVNYGQGAASQEYDNEVQRLGNLAGAQFGPGNAGAVYQQGMADSITSDMQKRAALGTAGNSAFRTLSNYYGNRAGNSSVL